MTRASITLVLTFAVFTAGCSDSPAEAQVESNDDVPCLSGAVESAFNQTDEGGYWDMLGTRFTIVWEGDIGETVGRLAVSVDESNQTLLVRQETEQDNQELRYRQEFYNLVTNRDTEQEETVLGRDFHPQGAARLVAEEFKKDETDFWDSVDDLSIEEYNVSCVVRDGRDAVLLHHQSTTGEEQIVLEAAPPHRPISGFFVDPFLDEQGRVSFTYDPFSVDIDMEATRVAAQLALEVVSEPANEHYMNISAEVQDQSARIPFDELEFHIWDEDSRRAEKMFQMGHGTWEMGTVGWFVFYDNDRDEHLSTGDSYVASLRDDHVVRFYDLWADRYATTD
ncbi:MAG: hypothetical protein ACPGQL_11130 [Thermoplasmatota archaeon]